MNEETRKSSARRGPGRESIDRRRFLQFFAGGITVIVTVRQPLAGAQGTGSEYPADFNAYLRIGEDGRVSCFTGKIEMGQGIVTSLAQMLAEELDVSLESVDMVMGDTDLCPYDMGTFGSRSTKFFGPALRQASAEARFVLIRLASERLGIPPERLATEDGRVFVAGEPDRGVSYAELAGGARIERLVEIDVTPKGLAEHRISGQPALRTDAARKVTGRAVYAGDVRRPGMLYAAILRPPAHGATLKSLNTSAAEAVAGARVVRDGELIAVLHEYPDLAEKALAAIEAEFEVADVVVDNQTIFRHLQAAPATLQTVAERGSPGEGERLSTHSLESVFLNHYVAHAPMEPHTAVAEVEDGRATVWASTQTPFRARDEVAEALGLSRENVRVITPFVGGGFGGKTRNPQVVEAARLSKLAGCPVQVAWSRREEFFYDTFRPAAVIKVKSGLDGGHRIVHWDFEILYAGTRSSEPVYAIPHYRVTSRGGWSGAAPVHPFGVGAWRGPGSNTNVFAIESQIDILAEAAGLDPVEFRLRNLEDERMRRVVQAVAEGSGLKWGKPPGGNGFGIACTNYLDTCVAATAEVRVDRASGRIRVARVVCAQDAGEIVNPRGTRLQIEGCVTMGLGYALTEKIRFRGGRILDENFDTYEIPRFSWLPRIETILIDNPEVPPQGVGEPSITLMGALIANAVYDATGVRFFELPMTPERVRRAVVESGNRSVFDGRSRKPVTIPGAVPARLGIEIEKENLLL